MMPDQLRFLLDVSGSDAVRGFCCQAVAAVQGKSEYALASQVVALFAQWIPDGGTMQLKLKSVAQSPHDPGGKSEPQRIPLPQFRPQVAVCFAQAVDHPEQV